MQRQIATVCAVLVWMCFSPFVLSFVYAGGECTPEQRLELSRIGYSLEQINNICGEPGTSRQQEQYNEPYQQYPEQQPYQQQRPQLGTICVTSFGTCPMMQPLPLNSPCVCYTVYGSIPGYVQ